MTTDQSQSVRPLVYAHRGASGAFAEHTRAAYLQALADGADGVECDLHLTRDQHPVLLHDANLDRTSDGTGPVADRNLRELRQLDFSSWRGARIPPEYGGTPAQFLTLVELLDILRAADREVGLAIEFKHPSPYQLRLEDRVLDVLRNEGWDASTSMLGNIRVSFMSFSPNAIKHLLRYVPAEVLCQLIDAVDIAGLPDGLRLGALTGGALANIMTSAHMESLRILDACEVGMAGPGIDYLRGHPGLVRRWLDSGRRLRVWTVDEDDDVALCQAMGIHEITTNQPARVLARLAAAGGRRTEPAGGNGGLGAGPMRPRGQGG